jgi:Ni,Fe-hydrogenase I large subunit
MTRIAIDPITRIEGHLRIEAEVEDGAVRNAWSSGTMFRGLEMILRDRDPREAWIFAQRACGVCTTVHALASVRCVEDALGITIPTNARLVRNLISASQFVHDHVIHFYHLHALDWVDVLSALSADVAATSRLARSISDWPNSTETYFQGVLERLRSFVSGGQLGPFANGYWGHPAYTLPPEANLLAVAHYLEALDWQRDFIKIHAILGGKNPHPQTYLAGGMAVRVAPDAPTGLNADAVSAIRGHLERAQQFVDQVLLPDVLLIGQHYKDWTTFGRGLGNYLTYGDFPERDDGAASFYVPRGRLLGLDLSQVLPVDTARIAETVARSWYEYQTGDAALKHPWDGETSPKYSGPIPPYETLAGSEKYSWLKAPRYGDTPMEVGPLARLLVAYAAGHPDVTRSVDRTLGQLEIGLEALPSTMGRLVARALETQLFVHKLPGWLDELAANVQQGRLDIMDTAHWEPATWPAEARGAGLEEAPRGALGHWIVIRDQRIANYQMVVPSTWNGSPRDAQGQRGAWEEALVGTPVADPARPVEILRTVHAFDPCMACAVHVFDAKGRNSIEIQVV